MKKNRWIFILFNLIAMLGMAQNTSTKGTEFWFGFSENIFTPTQSVLISSGRNTTGTISIPGQGWTQSFAVAADSIIEMEVPSVLAMATGSDSLEAKGIHLIANDTVSLVLVNSSSHSTAATNAFPVALLGKTYYVFSYAKVQGSETSQFLITAVEDNTIVEITPSAETLGGQLPGIPFTITMQSGEVYQVKSAMGDLTGSFINSYKPVAVFGGHKCAIIPSSAWCDHLFEQMYPISNWGLEFMTMPLETRLNGNTYILMASENNTLITLGGGASMVLNAGEFIEQIIENTIPISANKPISVGLYSNSQTFDSVSDSDPFLLLLIPLPQTIRKAIFHTLPGDAIKKHYLHILMQTSDVGTVQLDGDLLPNNFFEEIPATNYSFAAFNIKEGIHLLSSTDKTNFTAYTYGYGNAEGYGYSLGDIELFDIISSTKNIEQANYRLSPNPIKNQSVLYFEKEDSRPYQLRIFDVQGKLVQEKRNIESDWVLIEKMDLPLGLYFFQLSSVDGGNVFGKFMME